MNRLELVPSNEQFLQLSQKNLERNTKKTPPSEIFYVGLTYPENDVSQIRVAENKTNNWKNFYDRDIYYVNKLKLSVCFSSIRPIPCCSDPYIDYREVPEILKDITSDVWAQEVIKPLLKLIDEADLRQKELSTLLKSNPNVKTSAYIQSLMYLLLVDLNGTNTTGIRTIDLSSQTYAPIFYAIYLLLINFFNLLLIFVFLFWLILFGILKFTQALEYFICKNSNIDASKQFLDNLFRDHPDLDFDSVEDNLAVGVQRIVDNLNKVHLRTTSYEAVSWYGSQNVHHSRNGGGSNASWDRDEVKYVIIFNKKEDKV